MKFNNPAEFHKLYGVKKPKVVYYGRDFLDYALMLLLSALALGFSYGFRHPLSIAGMMLCGFTLATFLIRHGIELRVPVILRRPQEVLYLFVYKTQNLRPAYFIALGVLLLENLLIAATPRLPHHVELMRTVALCLFYLHLLAITGFRTASLIDHLRKRELVREVLMQTPWNRVVNEKTNITLEILHAYATGVLTHIILLAPWYFIITRANFSVVFLAAVCALDAMIHLRWLKVFNAWFYRDHWLGHNSECEFIYLHGTHHDAIPSGLIAVAGNGFLEGFLRFSIGSPLTFYNPIVSFLVHTFDIRNDIALHQFIPGIYPRLPKRWIEINQHATHHYGRLEPYSIGGKLDQPGIPEEYKRKFARFPDELTNSAKLDEELTDFEWDNPTHQRTLSLFEKYQV